MYVDVNKLKTLLKLDGVDVDYNSCEWDILIDSKIDELEGLIGVHIKPYDKSRFINKFKGKLLELSDYPVLEVVNVYINGVRLRECEYDVNDELGIIYFKKFKKGRLKVEYTIGFSERDFDYIIFPLLKDMIGYSIIYGNVKNQYGGLNGFASSLKEGDVSINFSSNNRSGIGVYGYDGGIDNRIDELRKKYSISARVRWL